MMELYKKTFIEPFENPFALVGGKSSKKIYDISQNDNDAIVVYLLLSLVNVNISQNQF